MCRATVEAIPFRTVTMAVLLCFSCHATTKPRRPFWAERVPLSDVGPFNRGEIGLVPMPSSERCARYLARQPQRWRPDVIDANQTLVREMVEELRFRGVRVERQPGGNLRVGILFDDLRPNTSPVNLLASSWILGGLVTVVDRNGDVVVEEDVRASGNTPSQALAVFFYAARRKVLKSPSFQELLR